MGSIRDAVLYNYPRDNAAFPEASPGSVFWQRLLGAAPGDISWKPLSASGYHRAILGISNKRCMFELHYNSFSATRAEAAAVVLVVTYQGTPGAAPTQMSEFTLSFLAHLSGPDTAQHRTRRRVHLHHLRRP
jgi:hypothetical protein